MLKKTEINNIINSISNNFHPKQIFLFGSYAYGNPSEESDLDILVVDDKTPSTKELAIQISSFLFPRNYGLDLIVTSKTELEEKKEKNLSFWKEILEKGKLVYEQP